MFRMYASTSHSYTHLILTLGIVREPTVWGFITSEYLGIHDIGLPTTGSTKGSSIEIRDRANGCCSFILSVGKTFQ